MSEPTLDEVVGRVREYAAFTRLYRLGGTEADADALDALLAAYQSVREERDALLADKARLDYLNHAVPSGEF